MNLVFSKLCVQINTVVLGWSVCQGLLKGSCGRLHGVLFQSLDRIGLDRVLDSFASRRVFFRDSMPML